MKLNRILTCTVAVFALSMPMVAMASIQSIGMVDLSGATPKSVSSDAGAKQPDGVFLAKKGSDDHGDDDHGGGHGSDDSGDDDHGGKGHGSDDDGSDDNGGRRDRVPGGSGCDDAHDILEHSECSI
jgi:hypothetical protein